jgi:hypothetical protein
VDFVDQFQRLMKLLFKWALIGLGCLVGIGVVMAAGLYGYEWWTVDRHKSKVRVEAKLQEKVCDKEFPVVVIVHNESSRTIEETTAYLSARRPGFSTDLTWPGTVSWDAIVKPGEHLGACWKIPLRDTEKDTDPRALEWGVKSFIVRFAE